MLMVMRISLIFSFVSICLGDDLYPSYKISTDPLKVTEWSNDRALAYVTTVRLHDYDHHIFQYRRYPCQYFYTDEIQIHVENETINQCLYNTTTVDYEYRFQLHLDSRHVEPFILRNLVIQCIYVKCSLSLLNMKYLQIGWNLKGRDENVGCSFDTHQPYAILNTPYTISEPITLRCKSLAACNRSKTNLKQSFSAHIQLLYGSSYDLEVPYCSLEKNLGHVIETKVARTNELLEKLVELIQRGFGPPNQREQAKFKEFVEQITENNNNSTNN